MGSTPKSQNKAKATEAITQRNWSTQARKTNTHREHMRDRDRVLNTLKINQSNETQLGKQGAGEINQ